MQVLICFLTIWFGLGLASDTIRIKAIPTEAAAAAAAAVEECDASPTIFSLFGGFNEIGSLLISTLLGEESNENNVRIRVILREGQTAPAATPNVEYLVSTSEDELAQAFSGSDGAFIIPHNPYSTKLDFFAESNRSLDLLLSALHRASVPRIVLLSSIGAHLDPAKHRVGILSTNFWAEHRFKTLPAISRLVYIRPGWNVENFKALAKAVSRKQSVLPSFLASNLEIEMISNHEVAWAMARHMLLRSSKQLLVQEVAMARGLTVQSVADAVGRVLKLQIRVVGVPETHRFHSYVGPSAQREWEESIVAFSSGLVVFEAPEKVFRVKIGMDEVVQPWFADGR